MYTDMEGRHIVEVLDRKRKQLDDEIARFKTEKEAEFQAFEKNFRGMIERSARKADGDSGNFGVGEHDLGIHIPSRSVLDGPASMQDYRPRYQISRESNRPSELSRSLQEAGVSAFTAARRNGAPTERNGAPSERKGSGWDKNGRYYNMPLSYSKYRANIVPRRPSTSRSPEHDSHMVPESTDLETQAVNIQGQLPTHHRPENHSLTRERDLEAPGLFVPNYLPLLSNEHSADTAVPESDKFEGQVENESHGRPQPTSNKPSRPTTQHALKSSTKPPRLSLPNSTTLQTPNTNPQRLSSSNPIRTSSPISTNLPSSLRSPTSRKIRSPKRVLFQIDDVVFTPSSTPPHKANQSSAVHVMPCTKENPSSAAADSAADDQTANPGAGDASNASTETRQRAVGGEHQAVNQGNHDTNAVATGDSSQSSTSSASSTAVAAGEPTTATDDEPEELFLLDEEIVDQKNVSLHSTYHDRSHHHRYNHHLLHHQYLSSLFPSPSPTFPSQTTKPARPTRMTNTLPSRKTKPPPPRPKMMTTPARAFRVYRPPCR